MRRGDRTVSPYVARSCRRVKARNNKSNEQIGLASVLRGSWLNLLLIFIPVSLAMELLGLPRLWLFAAAALAIIPLAGLIGESTEQLSHPLGPGIGGLLNATFGNATELIIALFALTAGLQEVVKASITGSIIGNILLVLGLSMFLGGWGRDKQAFNQTHAGASSAMLFLAVVALVMPAVFDLAVFGSLSRVTPSIESLSLLVAFVLMATYLASLVFSLKTHRDLFTSVPTASEPVRLSVVNSLELLVVATALTAVEAELLVNAIAEATVELGMSQFFVGAIVVAVVGNAAEHFSAVLMAMKNKMALSMAIATGSATQIALFVAPVLVLVAFLIGQPMSLIFTPFEIVAVGLSVVALVIVSLDGESNWFEGLQLLAVYVVLAIVFYFVPTV